MKVAQSCLTLAIPWSIQSMEFSRSEYWSGWNWRWSQSVMSDSLQPQGLYSLWNSPGQNTAVGDSESEVTWSCPTLCDPMDCSLPGSSVLGIFQTRILEWVAMSFSSGSSGPRDRTWVSHTAGRLLTIWATSVSSCSLLQRTFPNQGLNSGLLHCRRILYQLSHQGSLRILGWAAYPFSSRSFWPRNRTGISCTAGEFFTCW